MPCAGSMRPRPRSPPMARNLKMNDDPKAARDRAIADAIGRRLREIYDCSSQPMPELLATLLDRLQRAPRAGLILILCKSSVISSSPFLVKRCCYNAGHEINQIGA